MKIILLTNFDFSGPFSKGVLEIDAREVTLRDILLELSGESGLWLIDPETGEINSEDYFISIDGQECTMLNDGLETKISRDSTLKLDVIVSGGG